MILPSLLWNGRIYMYFQRFWGFFLRFSKCLNSLTEGGGVSSKSHISHDWSTSLWNTYEKKVDKFTAKQKKLILRSPREKKSNIKRFFNIFGLVRDVRQFKNKIQKRWLKTALLFFFVSYPNFLRGDIHTYFATQNSKFSFWLSG